MSVEIESYRRVLVSDGYYEYTFCVRKGELLWDFVFYCLDRNSCLMYLALSLRENFPGYHIALNTFSLASPILFSTTELVRDHIVISYKCEEAIDDFTMYVKCDPRVDVKEWECRYFKECTAKDDQFVYLTAYPEHGFEEVYAMLHDCRKNESLFCKYYQHVSVDICKIQFPNNKHRTLLL